MLAEQRERFWRMNEKMATKQTVNISSEVALLKQLEVARTEVLDAEEESRAGKPPLPLRMISFSDVELKPRWRSIIDNTIARPAYLAIRMQAREVGWMLY